jgi:hypothetical protein
LTAGGVEERIVQDGGGAGRGILDDRGIRCGTRIMRLMISMGGSKLVWLFPLILSGWVLEMWRTRR